VDIVAEALAAQEKLDAEVAEIKARALNETVKSVVKVVDSPAKLVIPPPMKENMQLADNFDCREEASVDPNFDYENSKLDNGEQLVNQGEDSDNDDDENPEKSDDEVEFLSRPGYIKPAPKFTGVKKAWDEVTELAEDLRYTFSDHVSMASSETSTGIQEESPVSFFKKYFFPTQTKSKKEKAAKKSEAE
jgi:hypothetical protein